MITFKRCLHTFKAILARCILGLHAVITVWRTTVSEGHPIYWILLLVLLGVIVDLVYVIVKRQGAEWKWFSPTMLFYLATAIPCVWLLELRRLENKRLGVDNVTNSNITIPQELLNLNPDIAQLASQLDQSFGNDEWVNFVEQAMLFIIVIARWMLPVSKQHMSRNQLSQLLLVYLALGADILELFAIFEEPEVLEQQAFIYAILACWSWSLMQFTIVFTASRAKANLDDDPDDNTTCCCDGEIWGILIMCSMLDVPFLTLRLTAMIYYKVATYTIYFFTCKNVLVVLLQGYRLVIVCCEQWEEVKEKKMKKKNKIESYAGAEEERKQESVTIKNSTLPDA